MSVFSEWRARQFVSNVKGRVKQSSVRSDATLDRTVADYFIGKLAKQAESGLRRQTSPSDSNSIKIGVVASALADVGGHTLCVKRFVESCRDDYQLYLWVSDLDQLQQSAPNTYQCLSQDTTLGGVSKQAAKREPLAAAYRLFNAIAAQSPQLLFVFISMNDVVMAGVLALIRRYTDIPIIYFNHGDHLYSLGIVSSQLVIGPREYALQTLSQARGGTRTDKVPLQGIKREDQRYFSRADIDDFRASMGIPESHFMTLTGCASNKLFDTSGSPYFTWLSQLLELEPQLTHLLLTELSEPQTRQLHEAFAGKEALLERLVIRRRINDFDLALQSADLFIDSFPIGSALVHIDMMRNKRPTVIKINTDDPLFSFEEYAFADYPQAYKSTAEMTQGIVQLLHNPDEQQALIEAAYRHFLASNEFDAVKKHYRQLIDNWAQTVSLPQK